jgi:acyl-coenzyme A synthetase/AMP-(fatty) acid ligase
MNVSEVFRALARRRPDATAIVQADDTTMSYRTLDRAIDRMARRALALGLQPGQIAGLSVAGRDEMIGLVLALALARIGVASADPRLAPHHLALSFALPGAAATPGVRAMTFDRSWLADTGDDDRPVSPWQDDAAIFRIFGTSGTTGEPRFCAVTHAEMALRVAGKGFPIVTGADRPVLICAMGIGGSAGLRACLTAFDAGGTVVFSNPARITKSVLQHGVTALAMSPRSLQDILKKVPLGVGALPSLRALRVSGSHLPPKLALAAAERLCPHIVTTFGSTETSNICSGRWGEFPDPLAIGRILPDMAVQAVDEDHQPLPPGTEGLLRFRGPGMVAGYFDDEAATAASFRDGWFYSGDRGAVTDDRVMLVTGRTGDFINSGGVKVNPRVIQDALLTVREVTEAVAFAAPDRDGLPQIWAAIVADVALPTSMLNRVCSQKLGQHAPKFILQMRELPRNENGKVMIAPLMAVAARYYQGMLAAGG